MAHQCAIERLNPHLPGIEVLRAIKNLDADRVFLQTILTTRQGFLDHKAQETTHTASACELGALQHALQLRVAASAPDSRLVVVGHEQRIVTGQFTYPRAEIDVVGITTGSGAYQTGVRVVLVGYSSTSDALFLDRSQAAQLRDELIGVASYRGEVEHFCAGNCELGIARCRPSQAEPQAWCPGFYLSSSGDRGLALSTPRRSFRFSSMGAGAEPFVDLLDVAAAFVVALESAIAELDDI